MSLHSSDLLLGDLPCTRPPHGPPSRSPGGWERRRLGAVLVGLVALGLVWGAAPDRAEAKLLELQLRIYGGGLAGLYGTESFDPAATDPALRDLSGEDFFKARTGGFFGGSLNVEVLFVDLTYEFYQLVDDHGMGNTLNNFLVGFDWDFKAGEKWLVTPYLLAGFGLATKNNSWLAKEHPQIGLADLESRLVMVRVGLQIEYKLGRFFRLGFDLGAGYHYGINTVTAANDLDGHSHGFHIIGNVNLAFVWNVFQRKKPKEPKVIIIKSGVGAEPGPGSPGPEADGRFPRETPAGGAGVPRGGTPGGTPGKTVGTDKSTKPAGPSTPPRTKARKKPAQKPKSRARERRNAPDEVEAIPRENLDTPTP